MMLLSKTDRCMRMKFKLIYTLKKGSEAHNKEFINIKGE
jgi:hypothetical protein